MKELRISFFLLFALFICIDITTTAHSIGIRNVLFGEIDYRLSVAAGEIENEIGEISKTIPLERVYPLIIKYSLGWVEFFNTKGQLIRSTTIKANILPEAFSDTSHFWGYRYGLFPVKNGYLLLSTSQEYLMGLRNLFRISTALRFLIYPVFIGLGIFLFRTFSYPFRTVEEAIGDDRKEIEYTMATIKEMAEDYKQKMRSLHDREKEIQQRLFLSHLGENVTQILHEIRNSTGAILGFGKLVKDKEIQDCLLEETYKLNRFANHLLSLTGPLKLNKESVNLSGFIKNVIDRFEKGGVSIEVDVGEEHLLKVDRTLMSQALFNVLDNAKDACIGGGVIKVLLKSSGKDFIITVEDTGKGMDEETLNSIFELFFTKKDGGVGVGMTLTKRIIEAHSGSIEVRSVLGKGTEVIIILPKDKDG